MKLSKLQRFILVKSYQQPDKKILKRDFNQFYSDKKKKPRHKDQQNIVSRSIERLIDNELATGYGRRTPHKWYIDTIKLNARGRRLAKKLLGEQQVLPLRIARRSIKKKRNG
jgi:hypothetical protein